MFAACSLGTVNCLYAAMLQAHSFLWNYLWVAPNLYLLALGVLMWRGGLLRRVPCIVAFAVVIPTMDLGRFVLDVAPWASADSFWIASWGAIIVESLLKFLVTGEAFSRVLQSYPSLARLGKLLMSGFGAILVLLGTLAAAFSQDRSQTRLVAGFHVLAQTEYIHSVWVDGFRIPICGALQADLGSIVIRDPAGTWSRLVRVPGFLGHFGQYESVPTWENAARFSRLCYLSLLCPALGLLCTASGQSGAQGRRVGAGALTLRSGIASWRGYYNSDVTDCA